VIHVAVVAPAMAVRAGLRALLSDDEKVAVIAEAATLLDLTPLPTETDVLILVSPEVVRSELENALYSANTPAILFLVQDDPIPLQWMDDLPARSWGILSLEASAEELLAAIGALHEGLLAGAPELIKPLLFHLPDSERLAAEPMLESLTERENQVLQLLAQGLANKQIALTLGISEHTVKFHISSIYAKLGATNRTEAVRLGVLRGMVVL
jgi:DNA-binding NarL/FixJ family response regulator